MKFINSGLILILFWFAFASEARASEEFMRGRVLNFGDDFVRVEITNGNEKGTKQDIQIDPNSTLPQKLRLSDSMEVVITKIDDLYYVSDYYRLDKVLYMVGVFFLGVLLLAKWRGVGSILGMIVSLSVIVGFIIPRILNGQDALLTTIVGAIFIMTTTIYLAHGISWRTTIALVSTLIVLIAVGIFATGSVNMVGLSGLGSEEAAMLFYGFAANVNFKGLLLGGIIIGAMGVLDDVTTSLSATVFELAKANPKASATSLLTSAMNVGREHITSLVNTLVLAYAGAALPMFIFLVSNPSNYPLWQILNSELLAEEVVRTIAGSMGLILAVPITALLATWFIKSKYVHLEDLQIKIKSEEKKK